MEKPLRMLKVLVCAGLVAASFGCASAQSHESTGEFIDNSVITAKVKTAIFNEPSLKTLQINVKTYKDKVQLSGFVDSAQSASKAADVARGVSGVASVQNDLLVK
ncbi:BON domain-containing protein [Geomonas silvestris]|uniref:BON domain-containing protein n=1 Tax=Geomonas silvestris TaxID=2740184 RepID=A0A6V8MN94_9BACT|nr:BON domain-containing protein [Geomonas silvestris]GFO61480.1 BON domain-containing protein [Geomonas silvestris]